MGFIHVLNHFAEFRTLVKETELCFRGVPHSAKEKELCFCGVSHAMPAKQIRFNGLKHITKTLANQGVRGKFGNLTKTFLSKG